MRILECASIAKLVMPGLVPGIHVFAAVGEERRGWPGRSPAMTKRDFTLAAGLELRGELFGPVPFRHVDNSLHRSDEFVNITHVGKIPLRCAPQRLRCDTIEQDQAEIAVFPSGCSAGVELFPAKTERGVVVFSGYLPMRDDVRMLADQRESLVGMRRQLEEQ